MWFLIALQFACVAAMAALWYLMVRNYYVGEYRIKVLSADESEEERMRKFKRLPSHEAMMFDLFRFDWSEYLNQEDDK